MSNIDKVSVKGEFFNIVSPSAFGDYIETIGGACTNPSGYAKDRIFLAKTNDVQNLYKATQAISFGANIVVGTNCEKTSLSEVIATSGGASSADQVSYDNSTSGLTADDVQEAIDEVNGKTNTNANNISSLNSALSNEVTTRAKLGGHNLLDTSNYIQDALTGVTVTRDKEGVFTINGTASVGGALIFKRTTGAELQQLNGMVMNLVSEGTLPSGATFRVVMRYTPWTIFGNTNGSDATISSIPNDSTAVDIDIYLPSGTYNNLKLKPQIRLASDANSDYQPYSMTNQELTEKVAPIGTQVTATLSSVEIPNAGAVTTVASITLDKGKWLVIASGYSPLAKQSHSNEATKIAISGSYIGASLNYMFSICGVIVVGSDNTAVNLQVTNWESTSVDSSSTNFVFSAIRIA